MNYLMISVKLVLLLTAVNARAQQPAAHSATTLATLPNELECQVLTGRITDPFANPLSGASIMLRSPGKGFSADAFSTNAEGHYMVTTRQAIPRNTIMEITAVGYTTLELPLTNCRPLDLTMTPRVSAKYKIKSRAKKPSGSGRTR